ncbi:MAG TPA: CarD family transcriptional regulator [Bryobacteraceae bacterium]|jgi:CarD family transcriptional regulator|nr:CarD family transcriptional regulator [Bryobacteraceae bacterium]
MNFQIGEKIVYPNHGVATIENISSRAFAGNFERFYLLRLVSNSLTVMVPFSHAGDLRLRKVTRNGEVVKVVDFLSQGRCRRHSDWKDRFKENTEKMADGSLLSVAEVLKSLLQLQAQKPLSFREKKMLDRARHMLITEFSTSRGLTEEQAAEMLEKALAKSDLHFPERL